MTALDVSIKMGGVEVKFAVGDGGARARDRSGTMEELISGSEALEGVVVRCRSRGAMDIQAVH